MTRSSTAATVVIPTLDPTCANALRTAALATESTISCHVVIVVDQEHAALGAVEAASAHRWTLTTTGRRSGSGPARNVGARTAPPSILVFLDDDMGAASSCVRAHLDFHAGGKRRVGLGGGGTVRTVEPSYFDLVLREWLDDWLASLARCCHYFDALCASNFSIDRQFFLEVGGFDNDFREWGRCDSELGHRLLRAGAGFGFVTGGDATETYAKRPSDLLRNFLQLGAADLELTEKWPELFDEVLLGRRHLAPRALREWRASMDADPTWVAAAVRTLDDGAAAGENDERLAELFWLLADHHYWRGVATGMAGMPSAAILDLSPLRRAPEDLQTVTRHVRRRPVAPLRDAVGGRAIGTLPIALTIDITDPDDLRPLAVLREAGLPVTAFLTADAVVGGMVGRVTTLGASTALLWAPTEHDQGALASDLSRAVTLLGAAGGAPDVVAFAPGTDSGRARDVARRLGVTIGCMSAPALAIAGRRSLRLPRIAIRVGDLDDLGRVLSEPEAHPLPVLGAAVLPHTRPFPNVSPLSPSDPFEWSRWCNAPVPCHP